MALTHIRLLVAIVLVAGIGLLTDMGRTEAAIDMTGTWNVNLEDKFATKIDTCTANITQVGSTLSLSISCTSLGSGSLTGLLTKATGVFVGLSGTVGGAAVSFSGTTDGNTASGVWSSDFLSGSFTMTNKSATPTPTTTPAFSITVDSTGDAVDAVPGDFACATAGAVCTLRAAIQETNALGIPTLEIFVPAGTYTLTIAGFGEDSSATGDLDITNDLNIFGAGANVTIVSQSTNDRVFDVLAGNSLTMTGLTIADGSAAPQGGGGIRNLGDLTLVDSTIRDNTAIIGGGIYQLGATALVASVTFSNNEASEGGGVLNQNSTLFVVNSTMSANAALLSGGALQQLVGTSDVNLYNTTITGNVADADNNGSGSGGGIALFAGTSTIRNTIVAGNTSLNGASPNCIGIWPSAGYNLIGHDDGCGFLATTGDQVGTLVSPVDPLLGPLTDNGGPTLTHAIHGMSPAVDAGNPATPGSGGNACEPVDQRNEARPKDGNLGTIATCDIGAYEAPEALLCPAVECLNLDMNANFIVTVSDLALNNAPCNASGVMRIALDAVGDGGGVGTLPIASQNGLEDRQFIIDFVSGWVTCPGPLGLGSSILSGGYIEEQTDTTPGLDFPADVVAVLCLRIDSTTVLGLLQNCQAGFAKTPIQLTCTATSYADFDCNISMTAGTPKFLDTSGVEKASIEDSETISIIGIPTEVPPAAVGGIALPDREIAPLASRGSPGAGPGRIAMLIAAIVAGAAAVAGTTWYVRRRSVS